MKRDEVIKLADKQLKSVSDIRNRIRLIDITLQENNHSTYDINEIKKEREQLNSKLANIIKTVGTLKDVDQKIICYRYFDQLILSQVGKMTGYSISTIPRRINKSLLAIGRVLFGFEDEFYLEVFGE